MRKRERQAYRRGQIDMRKTMIAMTAWTSIFIAMMIKAGMFVM